MKKEDKKRFLTAGVIAGLIFLLGIALGIIIDNERVRWVLSEREEQETDYQSLQVQMIYLNQLLEENASCPILRLELEDTLADLGYALEKLEAYEEESQFNKKKYILLKRSYLLSNLRYWLIAEKIKEACELPLVTILYFYSDEDCKICPDQGVVLTYYKKKYEDRLLNFPINIDLAEDEKMVEGLMKRYNITKLPSIVINGQKYEGVIYKKRLGEILCQAFDQTEC